MALTHLRVTEAANQAKALADFLKAWHVLATEFLAANSDLAIDWAAAQKPAYINEDVNGNLDGLGFTRQAVANVIGSFDNALKLLNNQSLAGSQGDHLGNVNVIADVAVTVAK